MAKARQHKTEQESKRKHNKGNILAWRKTMEEKFGDLHEDPGTGASRKPDKVHKDD